MSAIAPSAPRKSLSDQLDRLDAILDGLAEAIPDAVALAVRETLAETVREAVREAIEAVLAHPGLSGRPTVAPEPNPQQPAGARCEPEAAPASRPSVATRWRLAASTRAMKLATSFASATHRLRTRIDLERSRLRRWRKPILIGSACGIGLSLLASWMGPTVIGALGAVSIFALCLSLAALHCQNRPVSG